MAEFHQAKLRLGDTWFIMEGKSRAVRYAFEPGVRGDTCRWLLEQQHRKWMRSSSTWKFWQIDPPRPYDFRTVTIEPWAEAGGWLLTAVAIFKALR